MRIDCQEAIRVIRRYMQNDVTYPFLVAANKSSDIKAIVFSVSNTAKVINISDYCAEDGLPDEDALFNDVSHTDSALLIKGLGESIMLSGNAAFLRRVAFQTFPQKIIILCRNQGVLLEQFQHQDTKFGDSRWCELVDGNDTAIIRVDSRLPIKKIKGFKALLKKLENGSTGKLYVATEVPVRCSRVITSAYDAIREKAPSFAVPETALADEQWSEYLKDQKLESDKPLHWRTYLKYRLQGAPSPYLKLVLQYSPDYSSYKRELVAAILHVPHTADGFHQLYQERKMFLRQHSEIDIGEYVRDSLVKDADRIFYLTDNTTAEKHSIIEEASRRNLDIEAIEGVYPDFAAYLSDYSFPDPEQELFTRYFSEYKRQKVKNKLNEEFLQLVLDISLPGQRKYNSLPTRNMLMLGMKEEKSGLFWIDALGVEYLGYIKNLAKQLGLWLEIRIGRASLPTLTEFNRDFYENWTGFKFPKETRLDNIKHDGVGARSSTDPAIHLSEELEIIRKSLQDIKECLLSDNVNNILLASDHGASRLCVLHQHENRWQIKSWRMEEKGKHSGRCCPVSDADTCPDSATQERDFYVLANYDRFKGGRNANVEVHGGAALEEVVVPVIKITLANERITCRIFGSDDEIPTVKKPLDGPIVMQVFCSKAVEKLTLTIKGKDYCGVKTPANPSLYDVNLSEHGEIWHPSSAYEAIVFDGDNEITTLHFKIQRDRRTTRNDRDGHDFFGN